ncbi:MAG: polysaccharide deacetylase family protein [Woeseiaceae bacterium]|nr:polysaccharide deacetylase family protein [Woeseiaceae bacterium]
MRIRAAILVLLFGVSVAEGGPDLRTIALTFDDAPRGDGALFTGEQRTAALIESLARSGVDGAMFFVTTRNAERHGERGVARLKAYTEAGHSLANHSHSHQWLSRTDVDDYIADLDIATDRLAPLDNVEPFYRYPFLDEGRAIEKRDRLREALAERSLRNGYVTVDTYDWYLDSLVKVASDAGVEVDMDKVGELYVDVIVTSTEFYDSLAQQTLGRSPHHVLLLHENDLAALFVDDLVKRLRERGFRIIPATVAFDDPIAKREPDTLFLGQGRIAALAHESGRPPAELISPTEDEAYLRRRFEQEVAALPAP